ncbi:hypothetical protein KA119_00300 [Candidatus Gracilibacteria bacterium]|nr:hypothetical protein [Candidatus Gracilibacteria bacterium]
MSKPHILEEREGLPPSRSIEEGSKNGVTRRGAMVTSLKGAIGISLMSLVGCTKSQEPQETTPRSEQGAAAPKQPDNRPMYERLMEDPIFPKISVGTSEPVQIDSPRKKEIQATAKQILAVNNYLPGVINLAAHLQIPHEVKITYSGAEIEIIFEDINRVLMSFGLYLSTHTQEGQFGFKVFEVTKKTNITINDETVEALNLHDPDFNGQFTSHHGTTDMGFKRILVFQDQIDAFLKGVDPHIPRNLPNFNYALDDSQKAEYLKDVIIHEAAHIYLGKKFPLISGIGMMANPLRHKAGVILYVDGKKVDLQDYYQPKAFHELGAFGVQLMMSNSKVPIWPIFLTDPKPEQPGYAMIHRALPYLVYMNGPEEGAIAPQIKSSFAATGVLHPGDVVGLVGFPPYGDQHRKDAGGQAFIMGYKSLEALEKQAEEIH